MCVWGVQAGGQQGRAEPWDGRGLRALLTPSPFPMYTSSPHPSFEPSVSRLQPWPDGSPGPTHTPSALWARTSEGLARGSSPTPRPMQGEGLRTPEALQDMAVTG